MKKQERVILNRPSTIMMQWEVKGGTKWRKYIKTCMFLCFHVSFKHENSMLLYAVLVRNNTVAALVLTPSTTHLHTQAELVSSHAVLVKCSNTIYATYANSNLKRIDSSAKLSTVGFCV